MIDRRQFATAGLGMSLGLVAGSAGAVLSGAEASTQFKALERASGARLGIHIVDSSNGASFGQRTDERFLMCSTVKLLVVSRLLQRVDRGEESLQRRLRYGFDDLVPNSPVTHKHVDSGLTLAELCAAAMTRSDNAACNLIMTSYGGPTGVTAFARSIGDDVTLLTDVEPLLNRLRPGNPANTTSPGAMLHSLRELTLGKVLKPASRELLLKWMRANETGDRKLRAGLPMGMDMGDKTGGGENTSNDVAIVWPLGRAPWLISVFVTDSPATPEARDDTIAQVGRIAAGLIAS